MKGEIKAGLFITRGAIGEQQVKQVLLQSTETAFRVFFIFYFFFPMLRSTSFTCCVAGQRLKR